MESMSARLIKIRLEILDVIKNSPVITRKRSIRKIIKNFIAVSKDHIKSDSITGELITDFCHMVKTEGVRIKSKIPSNIDILHNSFDSSSSESIIKIKTQIDDNVYDTICFKSTYIKSHPDDIKITISHNLEDGNIREKLIEVDKVTKDKNPDLYDLLVNVMTIGIELIGDSLVESFILR